MRTQLEPSICIIDIDNDLPTKPAANYLLIAVAGDTPNEYNNMKLFNVYHKYTG